MRKSLLIAITALPLMGALPSTAWGVDYRFSAQTFMRGYALPAGDDTSRHLPFFEQINLETRDLGVQGLSLSASLWGAAHLLDIPLDETRVTGDVSLLYLGYRASDKSSLRGLELRLGRQFISAGPSVYEQLDGLYLNYRTPLRLDLTLFGGLPTGIRFTKQAWPTALNDYEFGGNWVAGGRLGYRLKQWANVGASYRHKRYDGEVAFHELGWDGAIHPVHWLTLIGDGTFELTAGRIKEARAMVRLDITKTLSAFGGYRFTEPDLFIPRSSIFSVFSDITNQELFIEGFWSPKRWLSLSAELGSRLFSETCNNDGYCDGSQSRIRALLRADLRLGSERQYRFSFVGEHAGAPDGGYTRGRIATYSRIWQRLAAVVEGDVFYLEKRDGNDAFIGMADDSRLSLTGAAYLTYPVANTITVLAGGRASIGPILKNQASFLLRLIWEMDGKSGTQGPTKVTRTASPTLAYLPGGAL